MQIDKLKKFIKQRRKDILNPDDLPEDEMIDVDYDEGEQAQLSLLDEIEGFLED